MGQFRRCDQDRRVCWGIVLLLVLRFVSAATINLSPQETYYWNYSIQPDLSYLDHPPMVAWVVRAGTLLLGKSEIGVRIGGLALVVVSTWLINALGRLWFSRRAGLWAALLFQVIPLYFIYGMTETTTETNKRRSADYPAPPSPSSARSDGSWVPTPDALIKSQVQSGPGRNIKKAI